MRLQALKNLFRHSESTYFSSCVVTDYVMSGVEVIGAISSVAQLVDVCFRVIQSLSDLLSTVRRIPEAMKQRQANVEQLQEILRMIRDCPVLQTANIGQVLERIATKLQNLRGILQKLINTSDKGIKKYCRALFGAVQEKRIISVFNELESDKTMLILCIVNVDSSLLHLIDSKFSGIAAKITEVSKELPNIQDATQRMRIILKAFHEIPTRNFLGNELPCRSNGDTNQNHNTSNVYKTSSLDGCGKTATPEVVEEYKVSTLDTQELVKSLLTVALGFNRVA
jgi:hypothetical protein